MEGEDLNHTIVRNPYCWTIEQRKDLLEDDGQNLGEDKIFILCGIRTVYLNYYVMEDGNWRFHDRTYFIHHQTRRLCFDIKEHEARFNQMVECLYVPLTYQPGMVQDIKDKALLILQKNEGSRVIQIIVDIVHRIPQRISNPYQRYDEEANEDELGLIEQQLATNPLTFGDTQMFAPVIPASRDAVEALEKMKVETLDEEKNSDETCMVCLDKLITKDVAELTRMPCKHLFHGACIVQWLDKNHACPLCRFKMPIDKK